MVEQPQKYSILMSVYHKEEPDNLRQSIKSMLEQTVPTQDFVIVCDGPLTDQLDAVLEEYQVAYPALFQILRLEQNVGLGMALNAGMKLCKCSLIARMDSDDISPSYRCEKQLEAFEAEPLDLVSGTISEFMQTPGDLNCYRVLPAEQKQILAYARTRSPFNHACTMYRKETVEQAGGYQHFLFFEDYYLWVRMLINGAVGKNLPDTLLHVRVGEEMYHRRGGLNYLKISLSFRWWMLRSGFSDLWSFAKSTLSQLVVCLLPNSLREKVYKKILRKAK